MEWLKHHFFTAHVNLDFSVHNIKIIWKFYTSKQSSIVEAALFYLCHRQKAPLMIDEQGG